MKFSLVSSLVFVFLLTTTLAKGQHTSATLHNDTLTLQNEQVQLRYLWHEGALKALQLQDKNTSHAFNFSASRTGFQLAEKEEKPLSAQLKVEEHPATALMPAHTSAVVETDWGSYQLRRIFSIFPNAPAISVAYYFKGDVSWQQATAEAGTPDGIEGDGVGKALSAARMELLELTGNHWKIMAVAFNDATDQNNNLVHETVVFPYKSPSLLSGNIFIAEALETGNRFFIIKEAPLDDKQLAYAGHDLLVQAGKLEIAGIGLLPKDINPNSWTRGYGYAIGAGGNTDFASLKGLRDYFKAKYPIQEAQREMIMANTWGDRSRDQRMNEKFILKELEAAARMGITHFQLDDGWQAGLSKNSGSTAGKLWKEWDKDHWKPHPQRFPRGLEPVMKKAKALGIEPGLWFNPSSGRSFASWRQDAEIILGLHKKYGVRYFKMDGIEIGNQEADKNLRLLLDTLRTASNGAIFLNLDATAGRRAGYFYLNDYGNIFLENRYTDWGNYYPAWTLRNLWMLSKYVPAENLQLEFLNKWRNKEKYPANDPLAPANYSFDYLFATTMMAQPLAWMEVSSLPQEAFSIAPIVKEYRALMQDMHAGIILPIGEVPNGFNWTGFQSAKEGEGYFLVFRENNEQATHRIETWLEEKVKVRITPLLGGGQAFEAETGTNGAIEFTIDKANSYRLYRYEML